MSAQIIPFAFDHRELRTVNRDGHPWFVASDVCAILGLGNPRAAVARHVDTEDRDGVTIRDVTDRNQRQTIVNESGLYALIFGSTLPEARRFKRWVTAEVLPAIHRTGKYSVDLRGWLLSGPKPWSKTFPDRFYTEILRLHDKAPERLKEQEPWLAQITDYLVYNRIEQGLRETLRKLNPIRTGKRWRGRKHHQHFVEPKAEQQLRLLIAECIGALSSAKNWTEFLSIWNVMHPLVEALPPAIEALLADDQLWLFNPSLIGARP